MASNVLVKLNGLVMGEEVIDEMITSFPSTLGRSESNSISDMVHICIGKYDLKISRRHIKLYFDELVQCFKMQCLHQNGFKVDNRLYMMNETAIVYSKSVVKVGTAIFSLTLQQPKKDELFIKDSLKPTTIQLSYLDLVLAAAQDSQLEMHGSGATQRDIISWIVANFPMYSDPTKLHKLTGGVYVVLNRYYERVAPSGTDASKYLKWRIRETSSSNNPSSDQEQKKKQKL